MRSVERLRGALLWLTGFSGAFVFMEPSPYEVVSLLTIIVFVLTGLTLRPAHMPLITLLLLYAVGFALAVVQVIDQSKPVIWVLVTWYLCATAVFFAVMLGANTNERLSLLMRGWMMAAAIASVTAILAYFQLLGSLSDLFLRFSRARGTFNDPNVLGAFLILPALLALQRILNGRLHDAFRGSVLLCLMVVAILLTFSRAAWGQFAFTAALLMFFTFVTSRSSNERLRIVVIAVAGVAVLALFVAALLSIDRVADLFKERASLEQELRCRPPRALRPIYPGFPTRARQPVGHRAATVRQDLPGRPAQHLSQHLHVGRLAVRLRLSHAGCDHADPGLALRLRADALADDLHRGLLRVCRRRGRKHHHRQRSLASLFPAARRSVGLDGRLAATPMDVPPP